MLELKKILDTFSVLIKKMSSLCIILTFFVVSLSCIRYCACLLSTRCITTRTESDVITDCSHKRFRNHLPPNIPNDTTRLYLSGNNFPILFNYSFTGLDFVRELYLDSSKISVVGSKTFQGLVRLELLDISKNFLDDHSLPSSTFSTTPALRTLKLGYNNFNSYPEDALEQLPNLEILIINGLDNVNFGNGFRSLKKLNHLEFDPCIFSKLRNTTFNVFEDIPLTFLSLRCQTKEIEINALRPLKSLKNIHIFGNSEMRVSQLLPLLIGLADNNLTTIYFTDNFRRSALLDVLTASTFSLIGVVCVKEVDLSHNHISLIQSRAIILMKYKNCLEKLILNRNFISGEIHVLFEIALLRNLRWLDLSNQASVHSKRTIKPILSDPPKKKKGQLNKSFSGTYTYVFNLPNQLKHLDLSRFIPNNNFRNINFTNGGNLQYLNLADAKFANCYRQFRGLPSLKTLIISHFNCSYLDIKMIRYCRNLTRFMSRQTHLSLGLKNDKDGEFLRHLELLEEIDFSGNGFEQLHDNMFQSQHDSVVSLNLSNNELTKMPINVEKYAKLTRLNIANNKILYLDIEDIGHIENFLSIHGDTLQLSLAGNPIVCNCDSINFIEWLQESKVKFDLKGNYSCKYFDKTIKTTKYAYENLKYIRTVCSSKLWLYASIILGVFFISLFIATTIAYKYRITIHYWYLNIRRKYRHYTLLEGECNEYKYDAFVAYCQKDQEWVCRTLVYFLEEVNSLKVCLGDRDFAAGKLIMDNIMDAISESKRTILIISSAFLESTWCEYELDMARMKMFQEKRDMLVVVLLDRISPSRMPSSLMRIWNKVTCLDVDEKFRSEQDNTYENLFWKRLYEALVM